MAEPKIHQQEPHVERLERLDTEGFPDKHATMDNEIREYVGGADAVEVDPATSTRLRRMINKRVLVVMLGTYFLQSLDKNALSFTAIMGIQKDAHLVGQDVSFPLFIVFVSLQLRTEAWVH